MCEIKFKDMTTDVVFFRLTRPFTTVRVSLVHLIKVHNFRVCNTFNVNDESTEDKINTTLISDLGDLVFFALFISRTYHYIRAIRELLLFLTTSRAI